MALRPKIETLAILFGMLFFASPVAAQSTESGDVAVLMTEVVEGGIVDDEQHLAFWWNTADIPQWTASDRVLFDALANSGVAAVRPTQVNISRIYRRPGLSTTNAAQLGSLLDARRVLVGEVQYRPLAPVAPLAFRGVEVRAVVELVPAGDADGVSLNRFTIRRQVYGNDYEKLLDEARREAGTALGEVLGHSLQRAGGEVGGDDNEGLLALRNVEKAETLEALRRRLTQIEEVEAVVERWASEGVIALEVVTEGDEDMLDYVYRVLENQDFDGFYIQRVDSPQIEGVAEFWIEARTAGF